MRWNLEDLAKELNSKIEHEMFGFHGEAEVDLYMLWFSGKDLKYYLQVIPAKLSINFAADPSEPMQGAPFFEYGFKCAYIEINTYLNPDKTEFTVIQFFEHKAERVGVRFSMHKRLDGNWYVWGNAWNESI